MFQGVTKSGSPTPSEIAPSVLCTTSKNFLMPLGASEAALAFTKFLILRLYAEAVFAAVHSRALYLVFL